MDLTHLTGITLRYLLEGPRGTEQCLAQNACSKLLFGGQGDKKDAVELYPPQRTVTFAKQVAWCLVESVCSINIGLL